MSSEVTERYSTTDTGFPASVREKGTGVKITVQEDEDEVTCGVGDIVVVLFGKLQPATQQTEIFSSPIAQ